MVHSEIIINCHYSGLNPIQFGYEDCEPGHFFGPAIRTYYLLHYVNYGCGVFDIGGKRWQVKEGDIFVIPPFVQTYYEADENTPWSYIWIGFEADKLPAELPQVIHSKKAQRIFLEMKQCSSLSGGKSAFLSGKIWELFGILLEESRQKEPDYVEKAVNRMNAEYMNGIRIEDIAGELHIDRSYFCGLFTKAMGEAPQQYLTNLRLRRAAELMTVYSQSPSMAAASTGYSDICNFSRMFRKKFGCSPREYMKQYQLEKQ